MTQPTDPAPVQAPKKPWKSLTTYAVLLLAALNGAQMAGVVPPGTPEAVSAVVTAVAALVGLFGRARAQGPLTLQ